MPTTYYLGVFAGGRYKQWANAIGQHYYEDTTDGQISYAVPTGFEESPSDTWARDDHSLSFPVWINNRTGIRTHEDPNPPPPRTYLEVRAVAVAIRDVERAPESQEYMYRRVIKLILQHFFPPPDYEVFVEEMPGQTHQDQGRADPLVLKLLGRPDAGGGLYDILLGECKKGGGAWDAAESQLRDHCDRSTNDSGNVYGLVQIGLWVKFYRGNRGLTLAPLCDSLHLRNQLDQVTQWLQYMKDNPLPFC